MCTFLLKITFPLFGISLDAETNDSIKINARKLRYFIFLLCVVDYTVPKKEMRKVGIEIMCEFDEDL